MFLGKFSISFCKTTYKSHHKNKELGAKEGKDGFRGYGVPNWGGYSLDSIYDPSADESNH